MPDAGLPSCRPSLLQVIQMRQEAYLQHAVRRQQLTAARALSSFASRIALKKMGVQESGVERAMNSPCH